MSFTLSAYICLFVILLAYWFGVLPEASLNDYDRLLIRRPAARSKHLFDAATEGVLTFADSQLLQGIAILVAAFAILDKLTVYHWQIIVYLAW